MLTFPLLLWKCCESLAGAVRSVDESATVIVPRLLFLDRYFSCEDKASWNWPEGAKIHVIGSLILQEIFRFQTVSIIPCAHVTLFHLSILLYVLGSSVALC